MITYVILTGGKSSRFGSDKSEIQFGGRSLLQLLFDTLPKGEIIVVGPGANSAHRSVTFVRENPPGGGPVAALDAGMAIVASEFVIVLAIDLPFAADLVHLLASHVGGNPDISDGVIPLDASGQRQMLCALYRAEPLRAALRTLGNTSGKSMKSLVNALNVRELTVDEDSQSKLLDIDTPQDLAKANEIRKRDEEKMKTWFEAVQKELGLDLTLDIDSILDVARDAAHAIERPAAPVTTYLLGYAVAQGMNVHEATDKLSALAKGWPPKE